MMSFKKILHSQSGVALMIVLSTIVILSALMIDFSFDTGVTRLKEENIEDRGKAKLMAEAGIQFAMARLRLYQEAYNFIQKNDGAKDFVKQSVLNTIWNFPFAYPIPQMEGMEVIQKEAIGEFMKQSILEGELTLTIQNISNKINLNLLRISVMKAVSDPAAAESESTQEEKDQYSPESQLYKFLEKAIQNKSDTDSLFQAEYTGIDIQKLIDTLKYYISDPLSIDDASSVSVLFDDLKIAPKFAPLSSINELHLIPGWKDDLIDLIKDDFTAHSSMVIDLNKLTDKTLRILIPNLTDVDIADFFKYRDGPEDPHEIKNLEDFKNYCVNVGHWISSEEFDKRFELFKKYGLTFGETPTLFQILSTGRFGRSTYNLIATVGFPLKPTPDPVAPVTPAAENPNDPNNNPEGEENVPTAPVNPDPTPAPPPPPQFLQPRIIEISVN